MQNHQDIRESIEYSRLVVILHVQKNLKQTQICKSQWFSNQVTVASIFEEDLRVIRIQEYNNIQHECNVDIQDNNIQRGYNVDCNENNSLLKILMNNHA